MLNQRGRHILFLHKNFPFGGAEKVTIEIANELCHYGYEVTVLTQCHNEKMYPPDCNRLFQVALLPKGKYKFSPCIARFIRNYIENHHIDVFVSYRELLYASWLKRKTHTLFIFALQSMPFYEMSHASLLSRIFYLSKYRRVYHTADAYGVLCEGNRQRLIKTMGLTLDNKIYVLPNSIRQIESVVWQKQKIILFVGRLSHRDKRVDRLLRIWSIAQKDLPEWRLCIIGEGPDKKHLETMTFEMGLQHVSFEGFSANPQPFYDKASILCLTSSFEGWGLVLTEAQANAVIPMAFNSFDAADTIISTSEEGILISPFNELSYAHELIELAKNEARRSVMQKAVVKKAKEYSISHTRKAWEQMLQDCFNKKIVP